MDARFVRQLHAALPLWTQNGWISPQQAALLAEHYPLAAQGSREWWQVLLSILAALCVGAGIIALFAANWHALSRPVRVALSLAPLLLGQAALLYSVLRQPLSVAWRESSALFVAVATGAAIALIAQTYHIESQGMFLHLWLWLTLPLVYLAGSWAVAFFVLFLVQAHGVSDFDLFIFRPHDLGSYLVYSAALLPWLALQWRRGATYAGQRNVWRSFVCCMVLATVPIVLLHSDPEIPQVWLLVGSGYLAVSTLQDEGYNLMQRVGMVFLGAMMLMMSDRFAYYHVPQIGGATVLYALSAAALAFALWRWRHLQLWDVAFVLAGGALTLPYLVQGLASEVWPWLATLAIVALGLWQLHRSLQHGHIVIINAALIWVLFALYLRFVEESMPLWIKGIAFIVAGGSLYALNLLAMRERRVRQGGQP